MRKTVITLVLLAGGLLLSESASACWKCSQKLRCYGDECWTEWVCVGNLFFPQLGWPECWESFYGCTTSGEVCRWTSLPENEKGTPVPFLREETPEPANGPLLCSAS